jgi:hypothetical protein
VRLHPNPWSLAVSVALTAAGCSGGGSGAFATPSTMPDSRAAWTPGSAAPLATGSYPNSEGGARQFVEVFFGAYNDAIATGDTSQVRRMLAPGCSCFAVFDQVDSTSHRGQHAVGERATFGGLSVVYLPEGTLAYFYVSGSGGQLVDAHGTLVTPIPSESPYAYVMHLAWTAGQGWLITKVEGQ